jgi:CheY-like chemotaxis protein
MPRSESAARSNLVTVLAVGPAEDDCAKLARLLQDAGPILGSRSIWTLTAAATPQAALDLLRHNEAAIAVCECDRSPGAWRELLRQFAQLAHPPCLIVTSRLADDYLWAEALNLGAFDVLSTPFRREEVIRAFTSAWLHFSAKREPRTAAHPGRKTVAPAPESVAVQYARAAAAG